MTKKIAVVYSSGYGHTEVVAKKIVEGIKSVSSVEAGIFKVDDLLANNKIEDLNSFDGIIFGSPTYMGSVSAKFKEFMDSCGKVWFGQQWKDKFAGGFTNSGSLNGDKGNTMNTLCAFAMQNSMIWISQGIFPNETLNRLGSWAGLYTQSENAPADQTPSGADLETSIAFGKRFAEFVTTKTK